MLGTHPVEQGGQVRRRSCLVRSGSDSLIEEHGPGRFTARIDLADAMLRQLDDDRFVRRIGHVITTQPNPSLLSMMLREAFKK
jgi:hypothetical protein